MAVFTWFTLPYVPLEINYRWKSFQSAGKSDARFSSEQIERATATGEDILKSARISCCHFPLGDVSRLPLPIQTRHFSCIYGQNTRKEIRQLSFGDFWAARGIEKEELPLSLRIHIIWISIPSRRAKRTYINDGGIKKKDARGQKRNGAIESEKKRDGSERRKEMARAHRRISV